MLGREDGKFKRTLLDLFPYYLNLSPIARSNADLLKERKLSIVLTGIFNPMGRYLFKADQK